VCVCLLLDTLYYCPEITFLKMSIFLSNWNGCNVGNENILLSLYLFGWWVRGVGVDLYKMGWSASNCVDVDLDLKWVRSPSAPMHLALTDRPFVSHIISR
jgi:hypothetical protein